MQRRQAYCIDSFARLGERLEDFGRTPRTRALADAAVAANPWFTVGDILFAVDALRCTMLQREVLSRWLSRYGGEPSGGKGKCVALIMAGNIPLVGFHDLLCVLASGHVPFVKPSSKDAVLTEYVIGLLRDTAPDAVVERYVPGGRYDAAIATGSDNTGRYFRTLFGEIPALIRGSRSSAAVLVGDESDAELEALGRDMFRYSGLGCRSVSLVFVPQGYDLDRFARRVAPRREEVNPKYFNNYRSLRAKLRAAGEPFLDAGTFVLTHGRDFPAVLSDIVAYPYRDMDEVRVWLEANDGRVQCVEGRALGHPRAVGFGEAQTPFPWDYPDGTDVMEFLRALGDRP